MTGYEKMAIASLQTEVQSRKNVKSSFLEIYEILSRFYKYSTTTHFVFYVSLMLYKVIQLY